MSHTLSRSSLGDESVHVHFGGMPENSQLGRSWNQVALALPSQVHRFLAGAAPFPCVSHSFLIRTTGMRTVATSQNGGVHQWDDETKHSEHRQPSVSRKSRPRQGGPGDGPWAEVTLRVTIGSVISCAHPKSRLENPEC